MSLYQFKVPRRSKKCAQCQCSFDPPFLLHSVLFGDEENLERKDFCQACFDQNKGSKESWGHWATELKRNAEKISPDERAMELFIESLEENDQAKAYFLSQYLKRKKQLIQRTEVKKEGFFFFEDPIKAELYSVPIVEVHAQTFFNIQKEILDQLKDSSLLVDKND